MKIYLDMCSLQRPLDTKAQLRVAVEAKAILGIIALCEAGQAELIASEALVFEIERNPHPVRKRYAVEVLSKAKRFVHADSKVAAQARTFHVLGIKPLDALHLASTVEAQADYFCTCDDRFLNRAKTVGTLPTKVVSPLELIAEVAR
jgi:predicted nucleic acid-binding protein